MIGPARSPLLFALALAACALPMARGEMPPQPNEEATLVVEGLVRESFRSIRSARIDFLYEIQVRSAQAGNAPVIPHEGPLPKSGDLIYVHAFQRRADAPQIPGAVGYRTLPAEQDVVRAYLFPRNGGGWQFGYPRGFERIGRSESDLGPGSIVPPPEPGSGAVSPRRIGVLVKLVALGNRSGLQVTEVTAGTPAGKAGLEPGDVILEAGNVPTRTLADLTSQVARAGDRLRLVIRNVRSGAIQTLDINLGGSD